MVLALLLAIQDSDIDRILRRFEQTRMKVQTEGEYLQAVDACRKELEELLARRPDGPESARARYHLAEMASYRKDYDGAIRLYDEFVKRHPSDALVPTARLAAAELAMLLERDEEAQLRFEEWRAAYPKDERGTRVRVYLAVIPMYRRKFDEAAKALRKLRTEIGDGAEAWTIAMQLVVCHHLAEKREEARATLEEIIKSCRERPVVESARRLLEEYALLGRELPSEKTTDALDREVHLGKLRGKVVVFYFFSPGLPFADEEVRFLRTLHERHKGGAVEIVGVSVTPRRNSFEQFCELHSIPWSTFWDGEGMNGKLARMYSVRGLPSLWVLDRRGRTRFFNLSGRNLHIAVETLLAEK